MPGARGLHAPPITLDQARAALQLDEALIAYFVCHDESQLEAQFFDPNSPTTLVGDGSDPNHPLVWGELDYSAETAEGKTSSGYVSRPAMNVAMYSTQYAGGTIGAPAAQALSTGGSTVVAILDTGIDATHPALGSAVQNAGYNFVLNNTDTRDLGDNADNDGDLAIVLSAIGGCPGDVDGDGAVNLFGPGRGAGQLWHERWRESGRRRCRW